MKSPQHQLHIDSFYHLTRRPGAEMLCQGMACFVARHLDPDRWRRAASQSPQVYHIGKCYAGPSSGADVARPRVEVHAAEAVVLGNIADGGARTLDANKRGGGYKALEKALGQSPEDIIRDVEVSGLRGRGGAGFPTGKKWRAVFGENNPPSAKFVIANADEGDPGAYIDRFLIEDDPHRLIEGMTIAAYAVGAGKGYIYLRGEYPQAFPVMQEALSAARQEGLLGNKVLKRDFSFDIEIVAGKGSYVCGEETALIRSVEGKRPEVIAFIAAGLQRMMEQYGANSIGVLGSARATNEENCLAQKFARVVLGTNNVDCCARVCHAPTATAMKLMLGTGAATNSFNDIERASTILVCGANPTENHPIVGARIKQRVLRGAKLIVIDPREIELTRYAGIHLPLRPGTNIPLLNAMACTIVEEHLYDESFIEERISEWQEFKDFIRQWTPERASGICGVDARMIREAARLYATGKPSMSIHGLGMTEHVQGTEGVMCLVNLALLTGNIGKPGTGINPLRGQNNVQGSAHMGCEPGSLTGAISLQDGKGLFESVWRAPVPTKRGMNLMEMIDAAVDGNLKGLWAIGYDVFLTNPDANKTRQALRSLEFVIVQDMFLNETAREFASVFLPVASSFEKDGTFMNAERRIQPVRKAIEPLGSSKPDWEIICAVARAMGKGEYFDFDSTNEIWEEIRRVWRGGSGITYERLEEGGIQWPCLSEEDPGTEVLHSGTFPFGRRTALSRIDYHPTGEIPTPEFPFLLTTGRTLTQFNAGTMTMRTDNVVYRPTDVLDISQEDAGRSGLRDGDRVKVTSRYGEVRMSIRISPSLKTGEAFSPVRIDPPVKPGELFATFTDAKVFTNDVTTPHRDDYTQTPEYKVTAVCIEKI